MIRRAALTWVSMIPVAITNGIIREIALKPLLGDRTARQVSVVTGSAAFLVLVYLMMRHQVGRETDRRLLEIGAVWVAATVVFEFGFGHYVDGKTWDELLHDYNIFAGRFWPVVLAVEFLAPLVTKHIVEREEATAGHGHDPQPQGVA